MTLPQMTSLTHLYLHSFGSQQEWHLLDRLLEYNLLPSQVEKLELFTYPLRKPLPESLWDIHQKLKGLKSVKISSKYGGENSLAPIMAKLKENKILVEIV